MLLKKEFLQEFLFLLDWTTFREPNKDFLFESKLPLQGVVSQVVKLATPCKIELCMLYYYYYYFWTVYWTWLLYNGLVVVAFFSSGVLYLANFSCEYNSQISQIVDLYNENTWPWNFQYICILLITSILCQLLIH